MGIIVHLHHKRADCPPKSTFATSKEHFIAFCAVESTVSLFMQPWWLDVVCPNKSWDVCLSYDETERIKGVLVYYKPQNSFLSTIKMPILTPHAGVWIRPQEDFMPPQQLIYAYPKSIMEELLLQLPQTAFYQQDFHYSVTDSGVFYKHQCEVKSRMSYFLEDIQDLEEIYDNFTEYTRIDIRKAQKDVVFGECDDIQLFQRMVDRLQAQQNEKAAYPFATFERLDALLSAKDLRKAYVALGTEGVPQAAIYVVYETKQDTKTAHFLFGTAGTERQHERAMTLLLWQAIQDASKKGIQNFDFGGNNHRLRWFSIFEKFNAVQKPFLTAYKHQNKFFALWNMFF
jgi:lipid II:glycine glycyltransferase (peptidoglycan interpeptide bridge formation enzyme)